ncbi:MAG TPA: cobalamin biosynthesis protein CbiX [Planctomycetaceae bacterium]|uniref:sirohydrochlorin chelatase n=1 Tax=Gimesia sp. TaxID=2024833 RepID=UPI000C5091A8|nr:CbiX/SirB N-terminal domain-containing protein [Gimesia sp.]MAX36979.1 cobalamin biosynthesis protein CbiX [Gimesia sp.]HAH46524.1 cobalamin biosynthesis protein CbiX [Planctomycetaceae bacterium]|tara:strand:+ start:26538 stop:26942 length:405 start_codon:yes stop_codon:yes gene_type:complete
MVESMSDARTKAVLLIAHGSRRDEANQDLVKLAAMLRERCQYAVVEHAYLELAEPDIPAGAARCVQAGAEEVLMLPYFLSAGVHVQNDLEEFRNEFSQAYPETRFQLCEHLGLHPLMLEIVLDRLQGAADQSTK